jgi:NAD(P)-dependent dehydrogenase (short-subunit alcohol dehydrogenase family)
MNRAAIVIGASGGIGSALVAALRAEGNYDLVIAVRRSSGDYPCDITDEASIAALAGTLAAEQVAPELIIVATGLLHQGGRGPEKSMRDLSADWMLQNYVVNAVGPALLAKHLLPLMPRDAVCRFAALSARVGSISDNHLGGWYGYRAAKAALNMLIRNIAIEWQHRHKRSIAVALHPGTVDTELSKPFQANVRPEKLFDTERAALQLLDVLEALQPGDSGRIFAWDGEEITP